MLARMWSNIVFKQNQHLLELKIVPFERFGNFSSSHDNEMNVMADLDAIIAD